MKKVKWLICSVFLLQAPLLVLAQGYNHQWLLGNFYFIQDPKGRATFDTASSNFVTEYRKMSFLGTQGNICDANGNFLMSSNGIWIANANNDTMLNGGGLNPGWGTSTYIYGLPLTANNVFLPFPNDTTKYILIHHSTSYLNGISYPSFDLSYSLIDITKVNGLGEVISKNNLIHNDTINWGIGCCKHANGRDWWVVTQKDSSNKIFVTYLNDSGIQITNTQVLNFAPFPWASVSQLTFSPNGSKFILNTYDNINQRNSFLVVSDFNRCTGMFSNTQTLQLTHGAYLWGLAFSSSGEYIYACSSGYLFQINSTTLAIDTVATFDGFISPPGSTCCYTDFFNLYLAANGKIYITSGSSVQHLGVINNPDSAGFLCDVQQHSIDLVDYLHLGAVPNHPNYYLGCDTTLGCPCLANVSLQENYPFYKLNIYPNPNNGSFTIGYDAMPQSSLLQVYDVNGSVVHQQYLPPWSNEQIIKLKGVSDGMYNVILSNGDKKVSKKIIILRE